jgi:putative oxidoreductase
LNLRRAGRKLAIMKIVTIIARILLGLMFVVFGLNGFLHFLSMKGELPPTAMQFIGAIATTGYGSVVFGLQTLGGLLVLIGLVPLGLTILCPIIVNILCFHCFLAPNGILPGAVAAILAIFLIWRYWANFAGLVRPGA